MVRRVSDTFRSAFQEYTVIRIIGEGGSRTVYEVTDTESRRHALKALDTQKSTSQKLRRFQNEIRFCQQTIHDNVVRVIDTGRSVAGRSFYVMDLYPCTLHEMLGKLKGEDVVRVFSNVLDGVEAAHLKSVAHRDLKPQNILCDPHRRLYVIADFGIASFAEEDLYAAVETQRNERLANLQYAAPEQRVRGEDVSSKADIYALGLILNQMFTGDIPLGTQFKTIGAIEPMFSYLDGIVEEMIRQDPAQRPSTADVKKHLIARKQQFINLQKIDQLTKQVVPEGTITDPLVVDPIRAQNFDYRDGYLQVTLSRAPNSEWIQQFQNQATASFVGMGPNTTNFRGGVLSVPTTGSTVVQQRSYVEGWIRNANGLYEEMLKYQMKVDKQRREQGLSQQLAKEEERRDILRLLGQP